MKIRRMMLAVVLGAAASGCTTPTTSTYYTLLANTDPGNPVAAAKAAGYAISVQPVDLPEQVDRPQIVVTAPASTEVVPLNSSLWASPLSDEIRQALANDLSRQLGALDIALRGAPESLPAWKINLTIQRFDSIYAERVVLDATWRLAPQRQPGKKLRFCGARVQVPVADGIPAIVEGHQKALHELALLIAAQLSGKPLDPAEGVLFKGCV